MSIHNILVPNQNHIYCKRLDADILAVSSVTVNGDLNVTGDVTSESLNTGVINSTDGVNTPYLRTDQIFNYVDETQIIDLSNITNDPPPSPPLNPGNINDNNIIIYRSLVPNVDNLLCLGTDGGKFYQLHISQIWGPDSSINVINALSGNGNLAPLPLQNGFLIEVNSLVAGQIQSPFTQYAVSQSEITDTTNTIAYASGPFASAQIVNWRVTRIGNTVSLKINFPHQICTSTNQFLTINLFGTEFDENFLPTVQTYFLIPCLLDSVSNNVVLGLGSISPSGTILISNLNGSTFAWTANLPPDTSHKCGLGIPDNDYFQINYNL